MHVYLTCPFVLSWSVLEAMSCGAAVVASDTAPVREVIRDGETGRLVDFFDREALVGAVCALLEDTGGRDARRYDLRTVCLPAQRGWIDRLAGA